ncbi:MAG: aminopeptidase P family protein [Armatimonadetes bacterium]|nr:aminopeptidase P family protein [Armatimonadota bacterium]
MREHMRQMSGSMKFDAVIASSFENVAYLSGALILTQRLIPDRLALVIWPRGGGPTFVVCTIEESLARRDSWITDVRGYVEFAQSPLAPAVEILKGLGLEAGHIGIEMRHLTAHFFVELRALLPRATFTGCDRFLDEVRMVKEPEEVERLRRAAQVTDAAIRDAYASGTVGSTEREIATRMQMDLLHGGADEVAFMTMGAGPNARMAHPFPSDYRVQAGDIIRCDIGGSFQGYYSDLARTAVIGRATPPQIDTYRRIWEIHEEVITAARPGALVADLFHKAKTAFERAGFGFALPHIGHSLGMGLHEHPMVNARNTIPLEPNMVISLEQVHQGDDGERYHVEDLVWVTERGPQVLSRTRAWSELMVIGRASP